MKHRSTRDAYAYWSERRGRRVAPERSDIDPTAIPHVLADTFLLGCDEDRMIVRLAGTRVCALFGREIKGEPFAAFFGPGGGDAVRRLIDIVCGDTIATVAGVTAHLADTREVDLELLLLPLRHHGRLDSRVLGVLVPMKHPSWLGTTTVARLTLGMQRHMGAFVERRRPPAPFLPSTLPRVGAGGRLRHGLVVYDGGRS